MSAILPPAMSASPGVTIPLPRSISTCAAIWPVSMPDSRESAELFNKSSHSCPSISMVAVPALANIVEVIAGEIFSHPLSGCIPNTFAKPSCFSLSRPVISLKRNVLSRVTPSSPFIPTTCASCPSIIALSLTSSFFLPSKVSSRSKSVSAKS